MAERFVTITTFTEPSQAAIARSKLKDVGIECFLTEDSTHGLYGYAAGAIRLQVRQCDAERAVEALEVDSGKKCPQCGQQVQDWTQYCPNCKATIESDPRARVAVWVCPECGERIEAQFDICWKCGTTKDGTPPPDRQEFKEQKESDIPPSMQDVGPATPTVPTYLTGAIAALFFCWPLAILAVVNAVDAKRKLRAGNYAAAREASARAKKWCWISLVVGLVITVLWLCLFIVGAARS